MFHRSIITAVIGTALGATTSASLAQDPEKLKLGINNASHELVQCSAYFLIVSVALDNSKKNDLAQNYKEISERAFALASKAAEAAGLMKEVTPSRFEMEFVEMTKRINSNTSNISILSNQYASLCQDVMEHTDDRLRFWVEKATSE